MDNAIQPVALQYRIGNAGNFVNVPGGFVGQPKDNGCSNTVSRSRSVRNNGHADVHRRLGGFGWFTC
jgi:hypothetical protein